MMTREKSWGPFRTNLLTGQIQPRCGWLISGRRSATSFALTALVLFLAVGVRAETTNVLSKAEVEGRELARQIREARPAENLTNNGALKIRDAKGTKVELSIQCQVIVSPTNWSSYYRVPIELNPLASNRWAAVVTHAQHQPNSYFLREGFCGMGLLPAETDIPFANSDFWLCDLGLEFFHWPAQKVLKKEVKRSRGCTVLESTNPSPATNAYSRVVSWIDNESGGIVQAEAYDFKNKLLKEFAPKSFKKVAGQWQLQEIEIRNLQTGSRTRLEFNLGGE